LAKGGEKRGSMRLDFCEWSAGHVGEKPGKANRAVRKSGVSEECAGRRRNNAGKIEMRGVVGKMSEGAALHVHEGFFAGGMHEFEDKLVRVAGGEMEIVVVFARKRFSGGV